MVQLKIQFCFLMTLTIMAFPLPSSGDPTDSNKEIISPNGFQNSFPIIDHGPIKSSSNNTFHKLIPTNTTHNLNRTYIPNGHNVNITKIPFLDKHRSINTINQAFK